MSGIERENALFLTRRPHHAGYPAQAPRRPVPCIVALVALLAAYYVSAAYADFPGAVWNVVDILVVVVIALTVLVNVIDSLRVRRDPSAHLRQLPRDAITVVAAFVLMLFLHNSLLFLVPHGEDNVALWQYLDPAAVAILAWEGIALVRTSRQPD